MPQSDLELLTACANFTLSHTREVEESTFKDLQSSGATRLIMAHRVFRLQRAVLAVGIFSMFEATLQSKLGWSDPFSDLDRYLKRHTKLEIARSVANYRLAVNVLKHGRGTSYDQLVARRSTLDFALRAPDEDFFEEGEPPQVCRRLQLLREWSHDERIETAKTFARGA